MNIIIEEVLFSDKQISQIIKNISYQIISHYSKTKEVIILVLMDGCYNFSEELKKLLPSDKFIYKYIKVKSYEKNKFSGKIEIENIDFDFSDKTVLILDDIWDTGNTLYSVYNYLENLKNKPKEINICVLVERENNHKKNINVDFVGEKIKDNRFLVGFGLDYNEKYRDLSFIGLLKNNNIDEEEANSD